MTDLEIAQKNKLADANNLANNVITPASLTPTTPVKLANSTTDITNYPGITTGVAESIANEYNTLNAQLTEKQKAQETAGTNITDIMAQLTGKTADTQTANELAGVNKATEEQNKYAQQLADLNAQATSLNREAQAVPLQVQERALAGSTRGGNAPVNADLLRANALKALSIAQQSDIAAAALTGSTIRLEAAKNKAQQIVDLKYKPLEDALAIKQKNYDLNKDILEAYDKKRTEALGVALKKEETALADKKANETALQNLGLEARKNGATDAEVNAILDAKTVIDALKVGGNALATASTDIVKLDNGNTVVVDKRTGKVINTLGGAKSTTKTPSVIARTVAGTPVTGYTLVAGDDPYFIAQQNGISVNELKKLNPNVKDWNNIQPGATLNVPQPEQDAFLQYLKSTEGGKSLTDTSIQKLDKGLTVLNQLGVLQANVQDVKTGPLLGAFRSRNPWDTQAQTIKTSLNAIVPNLARGIYGEVGVLTDNDIKTYSQTIPNLGSTEEIRNAVLYITLDMIGKSIKNTLNVNAAAGRDVSGFADIYTEMESTKNSILAGIPNAQVPQAFKQQDDFLSQFGAEGVNSNITNSDFFNQLP